MEAEEVREQAPHSGEAQATRQVHYEQHYETSMHLALTMYHILL